MRPARIVVGLLALLFTVLTVFHLFKGVSATSVAAGRSWPCGSVARPVLPAPTDLAQATPVDGRQAFLLDQAACAAGRDRQLGSSLVSMLGAMALYGLLVATGGRRRIPAAGAPRGGSTSGSESSWSGAGASGGL